MYLRFPYITSVSFQPRVLKRWRRLDEHNPLVPYVHVSYLVCAEDDAGWMTNATPRLKAMHTHEGQLIFDWLGFEIWARFPSSGKPRRGWDWP